MYEHDLAWNNLQQLICHKIQPTNHKEMLEKPNDFQVPFVKNSVVQNELEQREA